MSELERFECCASLAHELLYLCFTHRSTSDFKIMSLVDKRSRRAENVTTNATETTSRPSDDFADWLEYGASERVKRPLRAQLYNSGYSHSELPISSILERRGTSPLFVESGVYRVGGDRLIWPRPKPILEMSPVYDTPPPLHHYSHSESFGYARPHSEGIFRASFYKDGTPSPVHPYARELPALLPFQEFALQTVRAEVHAAQRSKPPPFRPPPSPPRLRSRPLATSSPPHSRRTDETKTIRSPLLIAVRAIPSRTYLSRANAVEYSPQSQSSSSGFDSKNTSQQNHSTLSSLLHKELESPAYENWPLRSALTPILDASVDTHYEFDATLSLTETGEPASLGSYRNSDSRSRKAVAATSLPGNIDARVQAMKEEFQAYRKRRARDFLESAC